MATCDTIDVDVTPVNLEVDIWQQPGFDVEVEQYEVYFSIDGVNQGPPGPQGPPGQDSTVPGPPGTPGAQGLPGAAATVNAGATVTGAPGSNAQVTNSGSTTAAIFNFTIPRGDVGATGAQGNPGNQGIQGNPGPPLNFKGHVANAPALPASGNTTGDLWTTDDTGHAWSWNGSSWVDCGQWKGNTGATGAQGNPGTNASAVSTTSFTVPAVGATATVTLADASWVVVGQMIYADTAGGGPGLAGALQVTAKAGNVVTLLNPPSATPLSSLGVFIETPSNKIYVLDLNVPQSYTITKFSIKTVSGTCTASFNRNGTAISGAGSIAVSSTLATVTATQTCSVGDAITLVISANSSAADLSASVWIQP
jgi:hypothetical protein